MSDYIESNGRIFNDELERMLKEVAVAFFKVLSQYLSGETEENHEKPIKIAAVLPKSQMEHLTNTSRQCYRYTKLFGHFT
jgi:hypothetical protein